LEIRILLLTFNNGDNLETTTNFITMRSKIWVLATAALLATGVSFAHDGGGKDKGKGKKTAPKTCGKQCGKKH
jgi:hypothetical protein